MKTNEKFVLDVTQTNKVCGTGEVYARKCQEERKIPVLSCEGSCIKGEIARLAANLVTKEDQYARACHGELFSVPHSDMARWVRESEKVVVIDGCFLSCHGRIAENILDENQLVKFDALSIHGKYAHLMDIDDVPETERQQTARELAETIITRLKDDIRYPSVPLTPCACGNGSEVECGMGLKDSGGC